MLNLCQAERPGRIEKGRGESIEQVVVRQTGYTSVESGHLEGSMVDRSYGAVSANDPWSVNGTVILWKGNLATGNSFPDEKSHVQSASLMIRLRCVSIAASGKLVCPNTIVGQV
jgi:hypothetical protein